MAVMHIHEWTANKNTHCYTMNCLESKYPFLLKCMWIHTEYAEWLHSSEVTYVCHMTISSYLICCYNQLLHSISVTVPTISYLWNQEIAQLEFEVTVVKLLDFVICYILMQCRDSPVLIHLETSWLTHAECLLIWHITHCLSHKI